jgi:hypothetical protein
MSRGGQGGRGQAGGAEKRGEEDTNKFCSTSFDKYYL